jgi:hypothetical protein
MIFMYWGGRQLSEKAVYLVQSSQPAHHRDSPADLPAEIYVYKSVEPEGRQNMIAPRKPKPYYFTGVEILDRCGNDPSAGSPTETLLRLHLPLDDKVWTSSRCQVPMKEHNSSLEASPDHPIGRCDGRCVQRAGT